MKLTIRPQTLGTLTLQAGNRPQVRLSLSRPMVRVQGSGLVGPRGEQGPPGPPAEALVITAATAIGGHRAIGPDGHYADALTAPEVVGISLGAVAAGQPLTVQSEGALTETGWSWTPGRPVWLGSDGLLTQTPPIAGHSVQIGIALTATRLFLRITPPTQLI